MTLSLAASLAVVFCPVMRTNTEHKVKDSLGFCAPLPPPRDEVSLFLRRVDDRIVARRLEAEQIPGLLHVRRQRRRYVDRAAARMRQRDTAREQTQPVLHPARQLPVLDLEIFRIADDRITDMRHMGAQLMGTAGH